MISKSAPRAWAPALALALAGICFILYPAIRPYSDEASLSGAAAVASAAWIVAHSLAMGGFIRLMLGLLGLYSQLRSTAAGGLGLVALVVTWVGIGLTLPYYGAEAFALHAVGQEALKRQDVNLYVTLTNAIRFGASIWFFGVGLVALAVGAILFAIAIWRSGVLVKWSGIPLAVAFALFIPQFFTPPLVRVSHGLLILVSCGLIAWAMVSRGDAAPRRR